MDVPKYLQVLWQSKWLLLVGVAIAAVAAFFAGYQIIDGKVVPRTVQSFTAETTLLVTSDADNMYQAVIPGQELVEGQTQPETVDLASKAILYAYLLSGSDMRAQVEDQIGAFSDTDALTALRRTTQPGGDEAYPGRYTLPIIAVVGSSLDPDRAVEISQTAASDFQTQMTADQDAANLPDADRVVVSVLDQSPATAVEGSNPAIPAAITFVGVFLLFVAAAFIISGVKSSRIRRASDLTAGPVRRSDSGAGDEPAPSDADAELAGWRRSRRSRADESTAESTAESIDEPVSDDAERHEPAYTG